MQSETLAKEFARLVKEYHEGDDHTKPEAWNLLADYAVDNADAISAALSKPVANSTCGRRIERETNDGDAKNASSARDIYDPVGVEAHAENERSDDYGLRQPAHSDRSRREGTPLAALSDQERAVEVKAGDDVRRAASALLDTLWQIAWSGVRTHEENWAEMDKRFPQARWLNDALKATGPALVDVPVEPEPTIYVSRRSLDELLGGKGNHVALQTLIHNKPLRSGNGVPLYTYPPHREGEDSAEVERLRGLLDVALDALDLYSDPTSYLDRDGEPLPADAEIHEGVHAKETASSIRAALAATRSASATSASGGDHG